VAESPYAFTIEIHRGGTLLGTAPASVGPCVEDACFRAVLTGALPNDGVPPPVTVTPLWEHAGPPAVAGLTVTCGGTLAGSYGRRVFAAGAVALILDLLRREVLAKGESVEWGVSAVERSARPAPRFRARLEREPYPLRAGCVRGGTPGELAVAIEPAVLERIRAAVVASPAVERAGLLTGVLVHDRERGAAALTVSGEIPLAAGRGGASGTHFALGPESFQSARQTLAGAAAETVAVGWWHSHTACERCPREPSCTADTVCFSSDDVRVHASAFPAAYMVALVAGKVRDAPATAPGARLYGWQNGAIAERPLLPAGGPGAA
jgi:hypothetical protein